MFEVSFTGGSRVGWVNASWLLARLTANRQQLKLTSLGTYEFTPQQVVSIEPYGFIPLLAWGIRINHNRSGYPRSVIFWCMGSRDSVIEQIKEAGFRPEGEPVARAPGFPVRWSVIIGAILLWNALLLTDSGFNLAPKREPGVFTALALLLTFSLTWAIRKSPVVQRIVLRPGHEVGEIKSFLVLLKLISGPVSFVLHLPPRSCSPCRHVEFRS